MRAGCNGGVVGGLVVKALDCGVRGHRLESHLLLPREGFSPGFSPGIFPPDRKGLNISHTVLPVQSFGEKLTLKKKKKKLVALHMYIVIDHVSIQYHELDTAVSEPSHQTKFCCDV